MIFHQGFTHNTEGKFYWIFLDWIIPNLDFGRIITSNWAQTFKMCETLGNFELEQVWLFVTNSFCVFAALGCNIFKFGKFCEIQTISSLSSNMLGRGARWSSLCVFAITFQQIHTNTCQKIPGNTSQQIHTTTLQKNDSNMSLQILFNKTIQTQSNKSTSIHRGERILINSPTIHENIFRESYRNTRKLNTLYILGQSRPMACKA